MNPVLCRVGGSDRRTVPLGKRSWGKLATWSIALISVLLASGCSIPGIRWEATGIPGPPLATGEPTNQVHRCDVVTAQSPWASNGGFNRCDVAFRSDNGVQIDAFKVQGDISAALPSAIPLRPLLEQFPKEARSATGKINSYTLYLVALNPIVVVGVPDKPGDTGCFAPGWTKCFTAQEYYKLDQRYARRSSFTVYYNTSPPTRDGSFVLVPEWKSDSASLSTEKQVVTLSGNGKTIVLVQSGSTWQVGR